MKKLKKFSVLALSMALLVGVASCGGDNPTTEIPSSGTTEIPTSGTTETTPSTGEKTLLRKRISSVSANTENAKTVFYAGDEFDASGLLVNANIEYTYSDMTREFVETPMENYLLDSSKVDMSKAGVYEVKIACRYGQSTQETAYKVTVKPNIFDDVKGLTYLAGLKVEYKTGDNRIREIELGDTFKITSGEVNYRGIYKTVNQDGSITSEERRVSGFNIDASAVDTSKRGTYMIKYYVEEELDLDGDGTKEYKNRVETFTIVNVKNDVKSLELVEGDTTLMASTSGLDFSSWRIKITREHGQPEIVSLNPSEFLIEDCNQYIPGKQRAKITHIESGNQMFVEVNVEESTVENIKFYNSELIYDIGIDSDDDGIYDNGTLTWSPVEETKMTEDGVLTATYIRKEFKKGSVAGVDSYSRLTLQPTTKSGSFSINMTGPGKVILFMQSSGTDSREINLSGPKDGEITQLGDFEVHGTPTQVEFTATEAGKYTITASKTMYIFAVIVATQK